MLRLSTVVGLVCMIGLLTGAAPCWGDEPASSPMHESGPAEMERPHDAEPAHDAMSAKPMTAERMTAERVLALLRREKLGPETENGRDAFYVGNSRVYANLDEVSDRMRFAIPLGKASDMDAARFAALLKANYLAMGDVRFALNQDVIWLLYVHRLSTLTEADALSAVNQLVHHAKQYGHP